MKHFILFSGEGQGIVSLLENLEVHPYQRGNIAYVLLIALVEISSSQSGRP